MINHNKIEQNSLEWFEIKWGKIGGTLSKGLMVKSDTLLIDILSQRVEEFEPDADSYENAAMQRGNEMEPFARQYLNEYTGFNFLKSGWLQSEENELLGISPDGITECETKACETKCLARKKHTEIILTQEIPLDFLPQCVQYFTVNPKLESLFFCAFRPESKMNFVKELTRESVVNLGTKARPVLKPIKDWVAISMYEAEVLLKDLKEAELKLIF